MARVLWSLSLHVAGRWVLAGAVLVLAILAATDSAAAQEQPDDPIREARRLQEAGEDQAAADRLRAYLRDHPDELIGLRLLASVLESSGDLSGAGEAYEAALRAQPGDPLLRLDYGRMLVDAGEPERARGVLEPVADDSSAPPRIRADALAQLGRGALRAGEPEAAESLFRRALEMEARHGDALRLLRVLHRERAPWLQADGTFGEDDQPLRSYSAGLRGGLRLYSGLSTELRTGVERFSSEAVDETLTSARAMLQGRSDRLNLDASVWGGGFRRSRVEEGDWVGGAVVTLRGPAGTILRAESRRSPYLLTTASLDTALSAVSLGGAMGRPDARGWAGALSYRKDRFEDENWTEDLSAWLLAPVVRQPEGTLRLGYRFHAAGAGESAFGPVRPRELDSQGRLVGRYAPIYTPRELRSHSVLVDLRHEREGTATVVVEGSWGFRAEEEAPLLFPAVPGVPDAGTDRQFRRRDFTPWHLAGSARVPVAPALVLTLSGGYRQTAFRSRSFVETGWTFYDLPGDLR